VRSTVGGIHIKCLVCFWIELCNPTSRELLLGLLCGWIIDMLHFVGMIDFSAGIFMLAGLANFFAAQKTGGETIVRLCKRGFMLKDY
jgi:hypothetical protein